jgi:uncharacterized membrane protein (UPF0127 family)
LLQVQNVTRGKMLVEHGRVANNAWTRFKGLMGERRLPSGDGMLIMPCSSVHCMFMAIPIDVLYVSRDNRVVAVDHSLRPWRIGSIHRGVHYVIELPAGTAAATGTVAGDQLAAKY